MKYSYFYKQEWCADDREYDVFLSGYDGCERTNTIFKQTKAKSKYWLLFPQYQCDSSPEDGEEVLKSDKYEESDYIIEVISQIEEQFNPQMKLCIDCSGMLIPHLMFLLMHLQSLNIRNFEVIYSSPLFYQQEEDTIFGDIVETPRSIDGYEINCKVNAPEYVIMFAGYNEELVRNVALAKGSAIEKHIIIGFPPIEADMYQQSMIQLHKSSEILGEKGIIYHKASAYDPLVVAEKLEKILRGIEKKYCEKIGAINIAPLSTKACAVAAAIVYMYNQQSSLRIIYPPTKKYYTRQAVGIGKSYVYTLELPQYS